MTTSVCENGSNYAKEQPFAVIFLIDSSAGARLLTQRSREFPFLISRHSQLKQSPIWFPLNSMLS